MLSDEIAAFFQAGNSVHMGARGDDLAPSGTRAWAVVVSRDRVHMTAFVMTAGAKAMLADLGRHPEATITCGRPTDHVTWQAKGSCVEIRPARPSEREEIRRQTEIFRDTLASIGISRELTGGWRSWPCTAVRIRVTDLFNQTPGPGAGERVP